MLRHRHGWEEEKGREKKKENERHKGAVNTSLNSSVYFIPWDIFPFGFFIWPAKRSGSATEGEQLRRKEEKSWERRKLSFSHRVYVLEPGALHTKKKAHECFSITFHVSFCLPFFSDIHTLLEYTHRMDARVIEKYIYVLMTRALTRHPSLCVPRCFLPEHTWHIRHDVSTAMCAAHITLPIHSHPHSKMKRDRFLGDQQHEQWIKKIGKKKHFPMANFKLLLLLSFDFNWNFPFPPHCLPLAEQLLSISKRISFFWPSFLPSILAKPLFLCVV